MEKKFAGLDPKVIADVRRQLQEQGVSEKIKTPVRWAELRVLFRSARR